MSKWKAGQCVTIEGRRYRVTKRKDGYATCIFCGFISRQANEYPCVECIDSIPELLPYRRYLLPYGCYLKEIKPKS